MDPTKSATSVQSQDAGSVEPKDPQDVALFVQTLLQQVQDKFQNMSDQILNRIDEMGGRIDDLEHNLGELMQQAGVQGDDGQSQANQDEPK
ncbi:Heat shock factor-binding protein 1 [Halotydeus destructor]|nr:Heat shock factor-binding protein 1 [Halotydeus destructor]